jgi:hypothetical protein
LRSFVAAYVRLHPEQRDPHRARPRHLLVSSASREKERGPRRIYANDAIEVQCEPKLCIHGERAASAGAEGLRRGFDAFESAF